MKLQIGKQYNCVTAGNKIIICIAIINEHRGVFLTDWNIKPIVSWRFKVLDNGVDIECSNGNYYYTIQEVVTNEFSV